MNKKVVFTNGRDSKTFFVFVGSNTGKTSSAVIVFANGLNAIQEEYKTIDISNAFTQALSSIMKDHDLMDWSYEETDI